MQTAVITSLITAIAGLITAWLAIYRQRKLAKQQQIDAKELERFRHQLQEKAQSDARERDSQAQLDLHTEPLLDAAKDLLGRVRNIREGGFGSTYLNSEDERRRRIAELSTDYRFAKYWGTVESLYGSVTLIHLRRDTRTASVAESLDLVGKTFSNDVKYGHHLMVWREEQRAVAELMKLDGASNEIIGFATFVERFQATFAEWFAGFNRDLHSQDLTKNKRLKDLQDNINDLISALEGRSGKP